MPDTTDWTAPWVARKIKQHSSVTGVSVSAPGLLNIQRGELPAVTVATISTSHLDTAVFSRTLQRVPRPDFVVNVHSGATQSAEVLSQSRFEQVPIGGMGDLERAVAMRDVREYVNPETRYIERGLEQHSRITRFQQLALRKYQIERDGLSTVTVIFLYDYDMSAEAIRQARRDFGAFDIVVAANPNGRVTESAAAVAEQLGCEIHVWKSFMSRLHREHDAK